MKKTAFITTAILMASTTLVQAAELGLPSGAVLVGERHEGVTSQRLPIGAYAYGEAPSIWAEGTRRLEAWQTQNVELTTLQVVDPLKAQLVDQGYDVLFECRDVECGGFDFRFAQELLPEPDMHVNLADFRFVSAQRMTDTTPEYLTLMVSKNRSRSFIHVTTIGDKNPAEIMATVTATKSDPTETFEISAVSDIGSILEVKGLAVLEDLDFQPGSSNLADTEFASLAALASYLNGNPTMSVSLVGHTDAVGSMEANFRLSKARASSVRDRLINQFGVLAGQIDAQGVGFLAPVATNLSADGRSLNRRVEVVLTSTN